MFIRSSQIGKLEREAVTEIRPPIQQLSHLLKMVFIPYAKQEYNVTDSYGPGERMENVGPREFVSLVKNAKFVLTDSFHGAVFSLIFKRPFAVFERNKSGHVSMNSRLYDLLNLFEESYRLVEERETRDLGYLFDVDEDKIGRIMAAERERSLDYLKNAIDDRPPRSGRRTPRSQAPERRTDAPDAAHVLLYVRPGASQWKAIRTASLCRK